MLLGEIERLIGPVLAAARLIDQRLARGPVESAAVASRPDRQRHQDLLQRPGQREGRVGGDHDAEAIALDRAPEALEGHRSIAVPA